jgi:hypothetical protein
MTLIIVIFLILLLVILLFHEKCEFLSTIKLAASLLVGVSGLLLMYRGSQQKTHGNGSGSGMYFGGKVWNSPKYNKRSTGKQLGSRSTGKQLDVKQTTVKSRVYVEPRLKLTVRECDDARCISEGKKCNPLNEEFKHLIESNAPPHLSHVPLHSTWSKDFSRVISEDSPAKPYETRRNEFKRALHWGQLKLMLTEIEFLTLVMKEYDESKDTRPIYFVYAGAAPGDHTPYLHKLFNNVHFELYDPNPFSKLLSKKHDMISTHVQFFTDDTAEYWKDQKDKYVVFCSDIRTEPATDENVVENMKMQLKWWKIMQPQLSMFKFRLPWGEGFTEYPQGKIYIQPYPGPTSTETRLIVKAGADIIKYDNKKYESQLFHHNTVMRYVLYDCVLGELDLEHDHLDNCYDCVSFINIVEEYLRYMKQDINKETIYHLVQEIQNNITHVHNIYSQTIRSFNEYMTVFSKVCFKKKNGVVYSMCNHPENRRISTSRKWEGRTLATIDAYNDVNKKSKEKFGKGHGHDKPTTNIDGDDKCSAPTHHYGFIRDGDHYDEPIGSAHLDNLSIGEIVDEPAGDLSIGDIVE